eukprot:Gb_07994 [translate_table: standard]
MRREGVKRFGGSIMKKFLLRILVPLMGGDPVTTEPAVMIVDEETGVEGHTSDRTVCKWRPYIWPYKFWKRPYRPVEFSTSDWHEKRGASSGSTANEKHLGGGRPLNILQELQRVSGTPISKAQLLLGPIHADSNVDSGSDSEAEEVLGNQEKSRRVKFSKDKGGRKRKTPAVLSASLAKCSWRSTRLQRKSLGTPSPMDVVESSEEENDTMEPNSPDEKKSPQKSSLAALSGKEVSSRNPLVNEDLRSHLRVLNSLGISLTSTCACVNLLTLEIRNYLKEVLSILKEEKNEKD